MKLSSYVFLLIGMVLISFLYSCEKDNEAKENNANILGTWVAIERTISGCEDPGMDSITALTCTEAECIRYSFYIQKVPHEDTTRDSTTVQAFVQQMIVDNITRNESGTYSVSEDQISFCQEDEDEEICSSAQLEVSVSSLIITTKDSQSGCSERLVFMKEEDE